MEPGYNPLFIAVMKHMKWDEWKTHVWFHTKNPMFGNISPDEMIYRGRLEFLGRAITAMIEESGGTVATNELSREELRSKIAELEEKVTRYEEALKEISVHPFSAAKARAALLPISDEEFKKRCPTMLYFGQLVEYPINEEITEIPHTIFDGPVNNEGDSP